MYLDETTTKLLVFLAAALIVIVFLEFAFLYETNKECKELHRENHIISRGSQCVCKKRSFNAYCKRVAIKFTFHLIGICSGAEIVGKHNAFGNI